MLRFREICIIFAHIMKYSKYIRWFTFVGLLSIFMLQSIWLYNTYNLLKNDIRKECNEILENALYEEVDIIANNLKEGFTIGTRVVKSSLNDSINEFTYLYDGLSKNNYLSLNRIDSIAGELLKANNINVDYSINIVNPRTLDLIRKSNNNHETSWYTLGSKVLVTRLDMSEGIELILNNPISLIYQRINLLLLGTLIIMLLIIVCLIYQTNLIFILKRILQLREDFTYALIHDMKSPLSTIFMTLNFLHSGRMDGKPEMKEKYFQIAEEESDKLLKLTNKVLTISKLEKQKMEMRLSCVALAPMLERLIEKFKAKSEKPLHFALDLKVPTVAADEEYLEEVFSNLIDNAVKYSGEEVKITISSESNDTYTIVRVHDNGMGIARKHLPYVFNKFERGAASKRIRKGGAAGFGLGLSFVQQVIEAHQGNVFANSIENEFTEISIFLPNTTEVL